MKLLIVDDSNVIRSRIARAILNPEISNITIVGLARDGVEAIALFKAHKPDAVTMDLTMPNMDGLTCISEMMKITPDIQILVVSALTDKATAIESLKLGARGFLNKPFTDEELVESLQELMD